MYRVTEQGLRMALFYTHAYDRLIAPGFADFEQAIKAAPTELRQAMKRVGQAWRRHTEPLLQPAAA